MTPTYSYSRNCPRNTAVEPADPLGAQNLSKAIDLAGVGYAWHQPRRFHTIPEYLYFELISCTALLAWIRALTRKNGLPKTDPTIPAVAPAHIFRIKNVDCSSGEVTPNIFCKGSNTPRRVPFIKVWYTIPGIRPRWMPFNPSVWAIV